MSSQSNNLTTVLAGFYERNKNLLLFLFKIAIAAGLLIYIISFVNFREIVHSLNESAVEYILIAAALLIPNLFLQFYKWKLTAEYVLGVNDNKKIISSLFCGFSAGSFTPARIGEYFGRAISFKDKPLLQVTVATILDKFFPLLMVSFFGAFAAILFIHFYYDDSFYLTFSLFIVLFTLFYFLFLLFINPKFWGNILFNKLKESKKLYKIFSNLRVLKNLDKKYAVRMLGISFLFYACFLVQFSFLVAAFSHQMNFLKYIWSGNLMMFAKTVIPPVSLGELGIREGASVYFLSEMGELAAVAFNASIFLFLINVLVPSLIGLFFLLRKNDD